MNFEHFLTDIKTYRLWKTHCTVNRLNYNLICLNLEYFVLLCECFIKLLRNLIFSDVFKKKKNNLNSYSYTY